MRIPSSWARDQAREWKRDGAEHGTRVSHLSVDVLAFPSRLHLRLCDFLGLWRHLGIWSLGKRAKDLCTPCKRGMAGDAGVQSPKEM